MTAMSSLLDQNQMQIKVKKIKDVQKHQQKAQGASQGASASQAKGKRKRPVHHRKKFRTVASLMKPQSAASTSESEGNQDAMVSTDTEDDYVSTTNY